MSKFTGLTKKKREEREGKKKDGLQAFLSMIQGAQQKFVNEWSDKFNKLGAAVDSVFKVATNEVGRLWANQQQIVESVDHIDINVLAVAELNKRIFQRLASLENPGKDEAELATIAEALYKKDMSECFKLVIDRKQAEDAARKVAREAAMAAEKAAVEAKTEAELAEKALKEAEGESRLDAISKQGGRGSDIPDGAQIFGG